MAVLFEHKNWKASGCSPAECAPYRAPRLVRHVCVAVRHSGSRLAPPRVFALNQRPILASRYYEGPDAWSFLLLIPFSNSFRAANAVMPVEHPEVFHSVRRLL